jgi:phosphatidylserine decarboxylase
MRIATGGFSWIIAATALLILAGIGTFFSSDILQIFGYFFIGFFMFALIILLIFFRDPDRKIGDGIIAVADGIIQEITEIDDQDQHWIRISTFMNVHNVHVNRMPLDGEILQLSHHSGGYIPAFKKESERNERVELVIKTNIGLIKIILIAGTIARRIVPYVQQGDVVNKGKRIGLIRLGSRVDVYFPKTAVKIMIHRREHVRAGVDTIATTDV